MDDRLVVGWQIGRRPRAFRRVAVRCAHGYPAVTEQAARAEGGTPFPTTYWLTCPWLVAALARVEAAGGVERWSSAAAADPLSRQAWRARTRSSGGSARSSTSGSAAAATRSS